MQHNENAVRLVRLGSRIASSSTQALGVWRGGFRFEWSTVALERASRSFHGRPNSFAFQSDRNSILAVSRDSVGDEVGGEEGSGGMEKMLVDDGAEMERRNQPGHMTRDSASAVSAMQLAA
jgi:hypothetical protein